MDRTVNVSFDSIMDKMSKRLSDEIRKNVLLEAENEILRKNLDDLEKEDLPKDGE